MADWNPWLIYKVSDTLDEPEAGLRPLTALSCIAESAGSRGIGGSALRQLRNEGVLPKPHLCAPYCPYVGDATPC